jgi:hypothetical protein
MWIGVPIGILRASCRIFAFGTRMHPCDGRPGISWGWFVPWTPTTPPPGQSLRTEYADVPNAHGP